MPQLSLSASHLGRRIPSAAIMVSIGSVSQPCREPLPCMSQRDRLLVSSRNVDITRAQLERYMASKDRGVVFEALESVQFPESCRKNVRENPIDGSPILGMCLGMTEDWHNEVFVSVATRERPKLAVLLCNFAKWEVPGFHFTSIQCNKDYGAALHVDKNNAGDSYITGFGSYSGGELWLDDVRGDAGRVVDIKGQWIRFDGNRPHCVLPFHGRRYSLVFFSRIRGGDIGINPHLAGQARQLRSLGFPLPPQMPRIREHPPAYIRLAESRPKLARCRELILHDVGPCPVNFVLRFPDGRLEHVAMDCAAPMRHLMEALVPERDASDRKDGGGTTCFSKQGREAMLYLGSMPVLQGDTPLGICLQHGDVLHVSAALACGGSFRDDSGIGDDGSHGAGSRASTIRTEGDEANTLCPDAAAKGADGEGCNLEFDQPAKRPRLGFAGVH